MSRKIDLLTLRGINTKSANPQNGACFDIRNMRLNGDYWENVSEFCSSQDESLLALDGYKILYIHTSFGVKRYIAEKGGSVFHVALGDSIKPVQALSNNINGRLPTVTSFGSYLCIKYRDETPVVEKQFIWSDDKYVLFDMDMLEPLNSIVFKVESLDYNTDGKSLVAEIDVFNSSTYDVKSKRVMYNSVADRLNKSDYITGAPYIFFGYRLWDGAIVKSSKIYMIPTQFRAESASSVLVKKNDNNYKVYTGVCGCKLSFDIVLLPELFKTSLVKSVVIFSTRDNPIYDFEKFDILPFMRDAVNNSSTDYGGSRKGYISDIVKESLNSPFYELKEIEISQFVNNKSTVTISKKDYEQIEFNDIYKPNFSHHKITAYGDFEFNNRVHKYGIHSKLYEGYSPFFNAEKIDLGGTLFSYVKTYDVTREFLCVVSLEGDFERNHVLYREPYYDYKPLRGPNVFILPNIISYPDSRAKEMTIYVKYGSELKKVYSIKLKSSYGLNYSYSVNYEEPSLMDYRVLVIDGKVVSETPKIDDLLVEKNKIIVSNFGNPYAFEPDHNYFVGENNTTEIHSLSSILESSQAESTGIFPLTVFTSDGIYLMEQGVGLVLYQRIIKISKEVLFEKSEVLSLQNMLFFISERGLICVSGSKSELISDNFSDNDKLYFRDAKIIFLSYYLEILIYNQNNDYGYVYSLSSGVWYKRDIKGVVLSSNEFYDGVRIVDLSKKEDTNKPLLPYVLTRSCDYGDVGVVRIDSIVAQIKSRGIVSYEFKVYGSNNLEHWSEIGHASNTSKIRRTTASWRYFKFEIDVETMGAVYKNSEKTDFDAARFMFSSFLIEMYPRFAKHINSSDNDNTSIV